MGELAGVQPGTRAGLGGRAGGIGIADLDVPGRAAQGRRRQRRVTPAAWALRTRVSLEETNLHLASLAEAGLLGIVEEHGMATVYLTHRLDDPPLPGQWEAVEDKDWNAAWRADLHPVRVGAITIVAPWHERPGDGLALVIEPAQAFGTGHHETTTGCLTSLQALNLTGSTVLDVGTGTGVLALAAKQLGAQRVVGVDVDLLAVEAAAANAAANGLDIEVYPGSADAVSGRFDVVVANLDTATLSSVAGDLAQRVGREGILVASGVSNERVSEAVTALAAAGLAADATLGREWAVLAGSHTR
ncbi:MAG: methyltransferase [Nitriliruptorales bacterium]|nr:methyltransferase [Nitriliruptorales bacterium]